MTYTSVYAYKQMDRCCERTFHDEYETRRLNENLLAKRKDSGYSNSKIQLYRPTLNG